MHIHDERLPGEDIAVPDYVERDYLPVNPWSRPGTPLEEINAVVIHYVGNPGTTAKANRDYFAALALGRDGTYASSHFVVGLEGEVIQCIPLTEVAYAREIFDKLEVLYGVKFLIPQYAEFATSAGAALCGCEVDA